MADTGVAPSTSEATATSNANPPIDYMIAVLLGMPRDQILRGLHDGTVAAPKGAPAGWLPDWATNSSSGDGTGDGSPASPPDSGSGDGADGTGTRGGSDPRRGTVDRTTIQRWFAALDPAFSASSFDRLWNSAGADDRARTSALFGFLRRALIGDNGDADPLLMRRAAADGSSAATAISDWLAQSGHHAGVVNLAGKDGAELVRLAKTDIGYRYALAHLDSIALTGNRAIFASSNADGGLDRFDPDTGEANLTDGWLTDRAKMLAWKMKLDAGGDATISGDLDWVFIDRTMRDANGHPMRLQISGADRATRTNQVIFGANTADGEMLKGGTGTDRIYGGTGDDVIRGNAGDDHLEGGRGDDLVMGGTGNDELVSGQGNDELEGGSGGDLLQGNSGDDTLTGGSGADRMEGGVGFDTYVIDSGDGADTILDADGQGEIQFDGEILHGVTALADGNYASADGKAIYTLDGDINDGGTLTISFYANANPRAGDLPTNTVQIKNWKNGDLGIQLGGDGRGFSSTDTGNVDGPSSGDGSGASGDGAAPQPPEPIPMTSSEFAGGGGSDGTGAAGTDTSSSSDGAGAGTGAAAADVSNGATDASAGTASSANADSTSVATHPSEGPIPGSTSTVSSLLNPETIDAALRAFSGVPEAPDVTSSVSAAVHAAIGVTPHDLSSAMLDFHEAGDLATDHGGSEPLPAPMPTLTSRGHETSVAATGGAANLMSTQGMRRRAGG